MLTWSTSVQTYPRFFCSYNICSYPRYIHDVTSVLTDYSCLLYADDAKIYREIRIPKDHHFKRLQASLIEFNSWCKRDAWTVSIETCAAITFSRTRTPAHFTHMLNGQSIERVSCVKDLDVNLDAKLSFDAQLDDVVVPGSSKLDFIWCPRPHDLHDPVAQTLLVTFTSPVPRQWN